MATAAQKITLVVLARHPLQQAGAQPVQRPARSRPASRSRSWPRTSPGAACCRASPSARCVDADGNETGMFEIPAGGRRFRALELLVKQKRLAKTAPVPCVVRDGRHRRGGLARREHPARAAASARPVPRLPGAAREGPVRGGDRRRLLRLGRRRQAAAAARVGLAEAARRLCRGRHDARPAHGLHGHRRP